MNAQPSSRFMSDRLDVYRERLELEDRVLQKVASSSPLESPGNPCEEIEQAQVTRDRDTAEALRCLLAETRAEVTHALDRMKQGAYGYCEDCFATIPEERLRIVPEASRCIHCQLCWECAIEPCA